ncbi:serine hydrolase [Pseudonocardia acidicola]|uniref:Beta-lactamase family protein n=1 Tax=Pseudonocardia acidicola TaxID=2724939 RepID=A0ABX1S5D5_9PSEU|nr:beta-lactamase family protein [Pseudonocardia acidicola]
MIELLPATARTLLARTARAQRDGRVPSLVAGVVRDGALVWSAARGGRFADGDSSHRDVQYRLGSITKTITAIVVLRLRDEGLLGLDDALEKYLPGTPLGDRTVGQLLSHLAGAGSESPGQWWERTPGTTLAGLGLSDADVVLPAGRRFHYSNLGFGLLGELIARIRGRSWDAVVTDEVLAPLGMSRTTTRPSGAAAQGYAVHPWAEVLQPEPEHDAAAMAPAGQLWATAEDLARLATFLLGDTGNVLSADTLEEMTLPAGIDFSVPTWSSYGLGLQVQRTEQGSVLVGHGGSMPGFLALLWVDRDEGTGAIALANTTSGLDGGLAAGLLADLRAAEPRIVDAWAPSPSPVPLELLGPWYWGPSPYVLRAIPGGLLHLGGLGRPGRSSRFRPGPDGTWIGLDGYFAGETLRLDRVSLTLATFVFTRTPYDPAAPVPGGVDEAGWRA